MSNIEISSDLLLHLQNRLDDALDRSQAYDDEEDVVEPPRRPGTGSLGIKTGHLTGDRGFGPADEGEGADRDADRGVEGVPAESLAPRREPSGSAADTVRRVSRSQRRLSGVEYQHNPKYDAPAPSKKAPQARGTESQARPAKPQRPAQQPQRRAVPSRAPGAESSDSGLQKLLGFFEDKLTDPVYDDDEAFERRKELYAIFEDSIQRALSVTKRSQQYEDFAELTVLYFISEADRQGYTVDEIASLVREVS